jgi:hypothetical protein
MQVQEQPWAGQGMQGGKVQDKEPESNHHLLCACAYLCQRSRWDPPALLDTQLSNIRYAYKTISRTCSGQQQS